MSRRRNWKVLAWDRVADGELELNCPRCGVEAVLPTAGEARIIAAIGLDLVFDGLRPPDGFVPDEIQCRSCRTIFVSCHGAAGGGAD